MEGKGGHEDWKEGVSGEGVVEGGRQGEKGQKEEEENKKRRQDVWEGRRGRERVEGGREGVAYVSACY